MKGHVKTQQWEELVSIARTGVAKDIDQRHEEMQHDF